MYHQFNIQQFYVLPTQCIYVFCVDLRTEIFFPYSTLTGFYNRYLTLYSPVVTIRTTSLTFSNSTFCPHSVSVSFVWISEQTAIISLYNIDWLVFITERIIPFAILRVVSTRSRRHAPHHCNVYLLSVDALSLLGKSVRQHSEHVWAQVEVDEKCVRTLKRFVDFYFRRERGLEILPAYYARTS